MGNFQPEKPLQHENLEEENYIPEYSAENQAAVTSVGMEDTEYTDPELYTVALERTKALRTMDPGRAGIRMAVGGEGLLWAIDHIDPAVGRSFDSHGVALKNDPVEVLDSILTKGFDKERFVYTTRFMRQSEAGAAIGADHPFTEGGIIFTSKCNQKLAEGIAYVILGEEYSTVIDILRKKYQNVSIVPWNEAVKVVTEAYNVATGEHIGPAEITDENKPTYSKQVIHMAENKNPVDIPAPSEQSSGEVDIW